jgi:hypothetical protein
VQELCRSSCAGVVQEELQPIRYPGIAATDLMQRICCNEYIAIDLSQEICRNGKGYSTMRFGVQPGLQLSRARCNRRAFAFPAST